MTLSPNSDHVAADSLRDTLQELPIHVGEVYQHYKGGTYEIVALAVQEQTLEPCVVYKNMDTPLVWVRAWSNWNEEVEVEGKSVPRFTRIS